MFLHMWQPSRTKVGSSFVGQQILRSFGHSWLSVGEPSRRQDLPRLLHKDSQSQWRTLLSCYLFSSDKIFVTVEILSLVKDNGGRFLALDVPTGELYEVSDAEARIKVSQVRQPVFLFLELDLA